MLSFIKKKEVYGTILILIVSYIIYKIVKNIINKIVVKGKDPFEIKRKKTIINIFNNIFKYIMIIFIVLTLLTLYGINTSSLLAGVGIVGVVIGIGVQDALKDIIGGINIIMDDYFVVGDIVDFNGFIGTVIEFGIKYTKIKKITGEVLVLSNRNIDKIINISKEKSAIFITVPTAYEEKIEKVEKVLEDVLNISKEKYKDIEKVEYLGIESFSSSSIDYAIRITCKRETQWDVKRLILKEIKLAYDSNKIKIPYNQLEVHNGIKI